jgi:FMN phosphatase YigB (HAD superfamily)
MALTLLQYANYLDTRDLSWPSPPEIERPKAKPRLARLPEVRAITWSVYGTLLAVNGGELWFEHPDRFVMDIALDKTIQEFKMWGAMTRKPGPPANQLKSMYERILTEQRMLPSPRERYPEVLADHVWEEFIKKLLQNEYTFDAGFYGSLNEFSRKVAYFFHASIQGSGCYPGVAEALTRARAAGLIQGIIGDGQCFTLVQLERATSRQDPNANLDGLIDSQVRALSHDLRARKPSERLFRHGLQALVDKGISPQEVLHIGSRISLDVVPARRLNMKTALFAGDKASVETTLEELKTCASRPDVILTELAQLSEVVG